ncbi:MAG: BrnA antitoxin family protein [Nitrospiraceae bacterium]
MAKKRTASSVRGKRVARNAVHIADAQIDFSDIPEATDAQLRRMRRVGTATKGVAKQLIAIRLSPTLLASLRKLAAKRRKPYQTYIHELLEKAVHQAA